jgi:tRNA pseudouridine65 synthase
VTYKHRKPLHLIYQDDRIVAIYKPHAMQVHKSGLPWEKPPYALQTLRDQLGCHVHPIHRLDRATAGVLLFALDREMAGMLSKPFAERTAKKTYLACVRGYLADGFSDRPLAVDEVERACRTTWTQLARVQIPWELGAFKTQRYSLVMCHPETGRRHQIRRHLKHASHPIVGDGSHGDLHHNRLWKSAFGVQRLMLIAARLQISHPLTGAPLDLIAPPDEELVKVWDRVGLKWPGPIRAPAPVIPAPVIPAPAP